MAVVERFEHHDLEGLRVGRFTSQLNTTCILYRLGSTVLDTGPPNQWRHVRRFLEEREVRKVLVTHHHEDHSGNLAPIQRRWDPELLAPRPGRQLLSRGFEVHAYRRVIWGAPDRITTLPLPDEVDVDDRIRLRAIHTPGHSPDSTCFLDPERGWLFTGDLYIASRTRYLRTDENVGGYMSSLRRVLEEEFETLLCSHRGVIHRGREALRRKLDYLVSLCEQVERLRDEGKSVRETTRLLIGREDHMTLLSRGHFSKRNLIESCLAAAEQARVRET